MRVTRGLPVLQVASLPALSQDQGPCLAPLCPSTLAHPEFSWQEGKEGTSIPLSRSDPITSNFFVLHYQELVTQPLQVQGGCPPRWIAEGGT